MIHSKPISQSQQNRDSGGRSAESIGEPPTQGFSRSRDDPSPKEAMESAGSQVSPSFGSRDNRSDVEHEASESSADPSEATSASDPSGDEPLSFKILPTGDFFLDLHGFPVEVAKVAVQVAIEDIVLRPVPPSNSRRGGRGDFIIVTGRGKHSPGGVALIRPAVMAFLREDLGLVCIESERDGKGRLRVPAEELWRLRGVPQETVADILRTS
eukprot:TRINITY_DN7484_c1_g1_i1.p1 TRINITY_DN7484_c1_g1~~TRINITY_DN7484_c1_g1_i1.p1  ORF type:complete len:247 (-),score=45.22 TRINITY_DN7484_c1_g1_i1:160-795(-)